MCGRFVSARKRLELLEEFAVQRDSVAVDRDPDYNVAPTKRIYTILNHKPPARGEPDMLFESGSPRAGTGGTGGRPPGDKYVSCGWSAGVWCRAGPRTPRAVPG